MAKKLMNSKLYNLYGWHVDDIQLHTEIIDIECVLFYRISYSKKLLPQNGGFIKVLLLVQDPFGMEHESG